MKLTIERAALLKSLGHVQSVVERRNTIPILSNVKIDAGDASVRLNATDMDLDIVEAATADVSTPGSTTVSAHTLYDIVRKLPDGAQIDIDAAGDGQVVLSARQTLRAERVLHHGLVAEPHRLGAIPLQPRRLV